MSAHEVSNVVQDWLKDTTLPSNKNRS